MQNTRKRRTEPRETDEDGAKQANTKITTTTDTRSLFSPFRALGFVCNHVPPVLQPRGTTHFLTTCIGQAFHVYNCQKLKLVALGQHHEKIQCMAVHNDFTFTASGKTICKWQRGKVKLSFSSEAPAFHLSPFGEHLIVLCEDNIVRIYNISDGDLFNTLDDFDHRNFTVTTLVHPSTYLNKVLLGSKEGGLQLWNLRKRALLYEFKGWNSTVTYLAQSPAVDIVAVGLEDGHIHLHNLKYDKLVMSFLQDGGPVTSLSFRTDGNPHMCSASPAGHISVWDLEKIQLDSVIRGAHHGAVVSVSYLLSNSILVSTGTDNAIKMWIFDETGGAARLLRSRSGHHGPPNRVRHYGAEGEMLLTSGQDQSLRCSYVMSDARSVELSQGSIQKKSKRLGISEDQLKLPPVLDFAAEPLRERDWDNIVSCHLGKNYAQTWTLQNKRVGKHRLRLDDVEGDIKCVAISCCGNNAILGYTSGEIAKFNIQSGLFRTQFKQGKRKAHTNMVRGIACDSLNKITVSCAMDKTLKFWNFKSGKLIEAVSLDESGILLSHHRENKLICVALQSFDLLIFDIDTRRKVRVFSGHSNRITDLAWSADGRWLLSSSMDSSIRIWDLPSGMGLWSFSVLSPATSLSMSPTGDYLATTHVGNLGVFLWANRTLTSTVSVTPQDSTSTPQLLHFPHSIDESQKDADIEDDDDSGAENEMSSALLEPIAPIEREGLVMLTDVPKSRWENLSKLADIRRRNKPTEPPKAPEKAPFFLPTVAGLESTFDVSGAIGNDDKKPEDGSRLVNFGSLGFKSDFQNLVHKCSQSENYDNLLQKMKKLSLSSVDIEIRSLNTDDLLPFLNFLNACLISRKDFELVQSYMNLFLLVHGSSILEMPEMEDALQETKELQDAAWVHMEGLLQHSTSTVNFLRGGGL
eukprot:m.97884 g.97884  ORF g.97884 m.97884 type:complete len:916 (+) comp13615_c2_seq1:242-2989(+)